MTKALVLGLAFLVSSALVQAQDQGQQTPPQSTAPSAGQTSPDATQPAPAPDQTTPDNTQTPSNSGTMQNSPPSQQPTGPMSNSTSSSANAQATPTTTTGCVRISVDHFVLKDDSGKTYNLAGDTANLNENVGQQVTVTGVVDNTSAANNTNVATPQAANETQQPTITVQSVQKTGGNCMKGGK
jgi:hypothetical protein